MIIKGKYEVDSNFTTVYSDNTIYTIARNTGEWGCVSVGQMTAMGWYSLKKHMINWLLNVKKKEYLSYNKNLIGGNDMEKSREVAIKILNLFEELLDEYDITIETEERNDYIEDLDDSEKDGVARLFGEPYYSLEDSVTEVLNKDYICPIEFDGEMKDRTYNVEIYKDEEGKTMVYISSENASGCKYKVNSPDEVGQLVANYIATFDNDF